MEEIIYIPDEIILVRMMTALDLHFEKDMHYHDEGMRVTIITVASFDLAEYTANQCPDILRMYHSMKGFASPNLQ